jgi:hypothetical protein
VAAEPYGGHADLPALAGPLQMEIDDLFPVAETEIGVIVLSQYVSPAYAVALLSQGSERRGYLLKDRVADVDDLVDAIRVVAAGGAVIDPKVVELAAYRGADDLCPLAPKRAQVALAQSVFHEARRDTPLELFDRLAGDLLDRNLAFHFAFKRATDLLDRRLLIEPQVQQRAAFEIDSITWPALHGHGAEARHGKH